MDSQKIQVIRQAEDQAQTIIATTEELVNTKIREAQSQASMIENDAKKNARDQELNLLSEYQKKGEKQAEVILSELERELSHINHTADKGEKEAVAYLKEQMKVVYGD
ncbi:MAG: hypothetical protein ACRCWI_05425 [Brevinema sp.]